MTARRPYLLAAIAAAACAGAATLIGLPSLHEAWLTGFVLWVGVAVGAIGMLMVGHLLGGDWLGAMRPELEAAARTTPLLALLALPVLIDLRHLYPWATPGVEGAMPVGLASWLDPTAFRIRAAISLALWVALAWAITRPGRRPWTAGIGLLLLALSAASAAQDWVMSRDPTWFGSLQGMAFVVEQFAAATAAAVLAMLVRTGWQRPPPERATGLERALLTLAIATLWLWFVQFVVVWAADIPAESAWYLRRSGGLWLWLKFGIALPAICAAIAFAAPPDWRVWRFAFVSVLLLVQHVGHMAWVLWPDAWVAPPQPWLAGLVAIVIGGVWGLWWSAEWTRRGTASTGTA